MTGTKIDTTSTVGIKITQSNQNPVVVTSQGTIVTDGNYAIYDATTTRGRVTNHGLLDSKSATGTGVIERAARSLLTNDGIITAGGTGVYMIGARSVVTNTGSITGQSTSGDGIVLASGGTITSGSQTMAQAVIAGGNDGILIEAGGGHIENYGSISGRAANGIKIESGNGTITNAGVGSRISGAVYGVVINDKGSVSNAGTITGQSGSGIYIGGTGTVTNTSGLISGGSYGVFAGGRNSAVSNFGTIDATTNSGVGIVLSQGGTVQNGSADIPGGTIHGGLDGVLVRNNGAQIANYGTITGGDGVGVRLESSTASKETVINGSGASANFLIGGNTYGVSMASDGVVRNDGTISGITGAGIYIAGDGTVGNGDASATGRVVTGGHYGIYIGQTGNVSNFGSIAGNNNSGIGVELRAGGMLANGSAAANTAAITGGNDGVLVNSGNAALTNFGTITGTRLYGIFIKDNGNASAITNKKDALITGVTGISFGGSGTLTNAGTMTGTGGTAVVLTGSADTLVVDPGAMFNGAVNGGSTANTLEFATGKGATSDIGTKFSHFGTVAFDAAAKWTLSGSNSAANLIDNGSVTIAAGASLTVTTAISAASMGIFQLASGATLEIAADIGAKNTMSFLASSELVVDNTSLFGTHVGTSAYTGPEIENFAAGDMIDLKNVAAAGAAFTYTAATGLLQITSNGTPVATLFFEQSTLGSGTFHIAADGSGHAIISHH
jgi:hypothetical protein